MNKLIILFVMCCICSGCDVVIKDSEAEEQQRQRNFESIPKWVITFKDPEEQVKCYIVNSHVSCIKLGDNK